MNKKFWALLLGIALATQMTLAAPFNANAKTKRISAGTKLTVKMLSPLTTATNLEGQEFSAL